MKSSNVISRDGEAVMQRNKGWQCQRAGTDLDSLSNLSGGKRLGLE